MKSETVTELSLGHSPEGVTVTPRSIINTRTLGAVCDISLDDLGKNFVFKLLYALLYALI